MLHCAWCLLTFDLLKYDHERNLPARAAGYGLIRGREVPFAIAIGRPLPGLKMPLKTLFLRHLSRLAKLLNPCGKP